MAFLSFAIPTPIIGLAQSMVLRRWSPHARFWVLASTAGWTSFFAAEIFHMKALPAIDQLAGKLVSAFAEYLVASTVGATLLGGVFAGADGYRTIVDSATSPPGPSAQLNAN